MEYTIKADPVSRIAAPGLTIQDKSFHERLKNAYNYSLKLPSLKENIRDAQRTLLRFGLVVEDHKEGDVSTSSVQIAHYFAKSILNPSTSCQHIDFNLDLSSEPNSPLLKIPPSSNLLLWHLSQEFNINIFLFSTRSKPIYFEVGDDRPSIGFIRHIDSFNGTSQCIVIGASSHITDSDIRPPSQPIKKDFISDIPCATFRRGKRAPKRKKKKFVDNLDSHRCKEFFEEAW